VVVAAVAGTGAPLPSLALAVEHEVMKAGSRWERAAAGSPPVSANAGSRSQQGASTELVRPARVVLADDSFIVREGLRMLLEAAGHEVVGTAGDLQGLLEAVEETAPAVVITDIRMPPTRTDEGIRAARRIRSDHPHLGVVVLSQYAEPGYALRLLEDGSAGLAYLLKERVADLDELQAAIDAVGRGESRIDSKIIDVLVRGRRREEESRLSDLTDREMEVLALLAMGRSNAAIAQQVFLSERAVEKNINAIFGKLGLEAARDSNRRVLAALAYLAEKD
jgi:DNA-binding NarL/FixJ family response regulator